MGWPAPPHTNFRRKFSCTYIPPITHITPIAASATSPHRTAERQPCRGANSLRPHPDGPHTPFGRRPSLLGGAAALM
jgi:hypothetical protein